MGAEYSETNAFRGARFFDADLRDVEFRECDLRGARIAASWLTDVRLSGPIDNLWVNDVDVAPLVEAELDRRHPERVQLRAMQSADDYQAMWPTLEQLWSDTVARARKLPEALLHERVDGEWSFIETLRHLVFATDAWAGSTILDDPAPYHRLGYTHATYPRDDAIALGVEPDAQPTLDEVLEARASRQGLVRGIVDALTDAEMARTCTRLPAPGYPDEPRTVGRCLRVVMNEECEHRRYAARDLTVLEAR